MKRSVETLFDELRRRVELPPQAPLYTLSNLDAKDAAHLREAWPALPVELRQQMLVRLVELAEADFEVNFGAVFRVGMEDADARVRATAIEGLWEDKDVRLVAPLAAHLREDTDAAVRAAAAESLGRFILLGELEKIRPGPRNRAYEALLAACQDTTEPLEVRRRALESLSYAGTEAVVELIRAAYGAPEEKMHVSAVFAMGRSADARWAPQVRQELCSPNPELRYEATHACGELQLSETVSELAELVEDADPEVQEAALWALGQIGGEKAREILERYCLSEDAAIQAAAEVALDELEFMYGDLADFFGRLAGEPDW